MKVIKTKLSNENAHIYIAAIKHDANGTEDISIMAVGDYPSRHFYKANDEVKEMLKDGVKNRIFSSYRLDLLEGDESVICKKDYKYWKNIKNK